MWFDQDVLVYMYVLDVMVNMLLSLTRRYWGQLSEVRKHVAEQKRREEAATNRLRVQLYQKVRLKMTPLRFYQLGARSSLAGLIAIFVSVHLSVCPSVTVWGGLGTS